MDGGVKRAKFRGSVPRLKLFLILDGSNNEREKREKEHLLRVKILTVQIISVITQRHPFLGARSQHLGGGW